MLAVGIGDGINAAEIVPEKFIVAGNAYHGSVVGTQFQSGNVYMPAVLFCQAKQFFLETVVGGYAAGNGNLFDI